MNKPNQPPRIIGSLIVHKVHGPGVVKEMLGPFDNASILVVQWVEDEGRLIIDPHNGRPPTITLGEVRPVTAPEQVIMAALYKEGLKELAHDWLREGRPHSYTKAESDIRKKIVNLMEKMDKRPVTDAMADKLFNLKVSLVLLPDKDRSLQGKVEHALQTAADIKAAKKNGNVKPPGLPLTGRMNTKPIGLN